MSPRYSNLVNVGCGRTFHRDWLNLDLVSYSPEVRACDLRKGIPLADSSCTAVYSSHVLEHLPLVDGVRMLRECFRVLEPDGTIRIVVPDLEKIARDYVACISASGPIDAFLHEWLLIEMYDQTTRTKPGGLMLSAIRSATDQQARLIEARLGQEARRVRTPQGGSAQAPTLWQTAVKAVRRAHMRTIEAVVTLLGGISAKQAWQEGCFRHSGEVHLQMYDRFLLARSLASAGFVSVRVCRADESRIPNFSGYELDTSLGVPRKPDSLYIEAVRPS